MSERDVNDIDEDLRARFGELRAEIERQPRSPSFATVIARAAEQARAQPALGVIEGWGLGSRRRLRTAAW